MMSVFKRRTQPGTRFWLGGGIESLEPRRLLSAASFLAPQVYPTFSVPREMAIGDFNGDGHPDIAATIAGGSQIAIFLNNGDGTLHRPPQYLQTDVFPRSVAAADFFHNGRIDLAVAAGRATGPGSVLEIFSGNGDGTFAKPPQRYPLFGGGQAVVAADLNDDGWDDIVVATESRIAVLVNQQNGTFAAPVYYNTGNDHPSALAVADFNNDGVPDLAVLRGATDKMTLLLGNKGAPGTFGAPIFIPVGGTPLAMAVGDFNHDGNEDLAVVNSNFRGVTLAILLGNGDGTFRPRASYSGVNFSDSIAAADFSGSGNEDLVVGSFTGPLKFFSGNGDGTFATPVNIPDAIFAQVVQTADFNGDGKPDLAVTPFGGLRILLNSTGTVTPPPIGPGSEQTIGAGGPRAFRFYTPDGTIATISLQGPGAATLHFTSSQTITVPSGRNFVQVTALQLANIAATGTTGATTLAISANAGSRTITFNSISTDGAFGAIVAPTTNLTGTLSLPGGARQVSLLSANNGSISIGAGPPPVLTLGQTNNETITSAVPINSMSVRLDAGVMLSAPSIGSLDVGGSLHDSIITLTAPFAAGAFNLGRVITMGGITNTSIHSPGNIGPIDAMNILNSAIEAGVGALAAGQELPTAPSDFAAAASIQSVRLLPNIHQPSFANSVIVASQEGAMNLSNIQTANGGTPFGLAAEFIASLSGTDLTTRRSFKIAKITSSAVAAAALAAKQINPQDLVVRIV